MALKCVLFLVALNVLYVTSHDTTLEFEHSSIEVSEGVGKVFLHVLRTGKELDGIAKVKFATKDGTAKAGSDFVGSSGTVMFMKGEDKKSIAVQIIDDKEPEPKEHFTVELSDLTVDDAKNDAVQLGEKKTVTVTIKDNDS